MQKIEIAVQKYHKTFWELKKSKRKEQTNSRCLPTLSLVVGPLHTGRRHIVSDKLINLTTNLLLNIATSWRQSSLRSYSSDNKHHVADRSSDSNLLIYHNLLLWICTFKNQLLFFRSYHIQKQKKLRMYNVPCCPCTYADWTIF